MGVAFGNRDVHEFVTYITGNGNGTGLLFLNIKSKTPPTGKVSVSQSFENFLKKISSIFNPILHMFPGQLTGHPIYF